MKPTRTSSRAFFLILLLIVSISFVITSVWLIQGVSDRREKVVELRSEIAIISSIESDSKKSIDQIDNGQLDLFQLSFASILAIEFDLDKHPSLKELSEKKQDLAHNFKDAVYPDNQGLIRSELQDFNVLCTAAINRKQNTLADHSEELATYWSYTHILIILASILVMTLSIFGYFLLQSRKKLRDLKMRNTLFVGNVADCVIICDNEGKVVSFNPAAEEIFGYSAQEILGQSIGLLYGSDNDWNHVKKELRASEYFKGEIVNARKNGDHFLSYLSANIVYDDNGVKTGTMGISRDITEQKRNDEQFQHIVDNAIDIIYTTNIEGNVTYVNTSANSVLGYTNADIIGLPFRKLIHPDYLAQVEQHYQDQFKNRTKETYLEFKMLKANGEAIWIGQNVRTTFSPINPNQIVGYFGILRNLNEIKKVEIDLKESETKYRELFDNSKDLIQSIDSNGWLLYVNEAWKNSLGYSDEEIKKLNLFDIIHKESRDYCEELLAEILKFGTDENQTAHVFRMISKGGEEIVLKGSISVKYEKGQVTSLQTFLRDVTEQYEVEQALKKSEENFRQISQSINDVFFLYDTVLNKYDFISPNCETVLGVKPSFFYEDGSYIKSFIHPEDQAAVVAMDKAVRNGVAGHVEYRRKVSDGELMWIDEEWFPIKDVAGTVTSISGVCRDITLVKEAYDIIYDQNKEISQSILYAKNIQQSTLPTKEEIKRILPESLIFYRAKDVLSGDLYLVETINDNNGNKWPAFVVGDCTGHGVPGGLLSLLCSGLLRESLTHQEINSPAEALEFVREKLIRLFRSNPSKYIMDGMDAAFCVFNEQTMELYFSGANLSCFVVREGEVLEYKGDKQHIGYNSKMAPFVPFSIDIEKGDAIYITTDGYVDQFGGEKNKKFLRKRFTQLLLDIQEFSMEQQEEKIAECFDAWKGDAEQTDDVAVIGVKV